jgi:hypothetical protein
MVIELQRDAYRLISGARDKGSRQRGIYPAGHGYDDAMRARRAGQPKMFRGEMGQCRDPAAACLRCFAAR